MFCAGVTCFALVLHLNCTALSQSESSNFFMCIINSVKESRVFVEAELEYLFLSIGVSCK